MYRFWPYILGMALFAAAVFLIRKENSYEGSGKVHIVQGEDGFHLIKDGEPFFIKGASGSVKYLDQLRAAGGNTIRFYDTLNLGQKLDSAHKYGLSVIVDIPIPAYGKNYNPYDTPYKRNGYKTLIERFVNQYKDHPALLMWVLGNEIRYPIFGSGDGFAPYFNDLVRLIKKTDPDHPVTTAIRQSGRHLILSLWYRTDLDLIAINSFGGVKELEHDLDQIKWLWNGPYMISEWNDEGPWKEFTTKWGAPIEPTSSKKAERLKNIYEHHIDPLKKRCLGSLVFYWGNKHERTHTWFSMFLEDGELTPSYYAMKQIFRNEDSLNYQGPVLDFLMLNRFGPQESMLLTAGQENVADIFFDAPNCESIIIQWEILPEVWNNSSHAAEQKPPSLNHLILSAQDNMVRFRTPDSEGPYRIFTYVKDKKGNVATANFPFYVISQANVQN